MPSRMFARHAQVVSALAALLVAMPCGAGYTVELPQLLGTHDQCDISFALTLPRLSGFTSARLEMSGTLVAGVRADCTREPYEFPAGATYAFIVSIPEYPEVLFDKAEGYLSPSASEWAVSVPFVQNLPSSVITLYGTLGAQFLLNDDHSVICYSYVVRPVVTINTARIVTDGIVGAEPATWGQVRKLYR